MVASSAFSLSQTSPVRRLVKAAGEAGRPVGLVQDLGDAGARQHRVELLAERQRRRRGVRRQRRDMQALVPQFDAGEFPLQQAGGEALQPLVQFLSTGGEPFIGGLRQVQAARDRRNGGGRQQVAVEPAIAGGTLDPDITGAEPVAQGGENGGFVQPPIWLVVLQDQLFPVFAEWHRRDLPAGRACPNG